MEEFSEALTWRTADIIGSERLRLMRAYRSERLIEPRSGRTSIDIKLGAVSGGRNNNLTLMRFVAAAAVVYAHSFGLLDATRIEPFFRTFGIGTGDVGVDVFFVISGFLVTKSLAGKNLIQFAWARIMRIFPALWVSSIILLLAVGLFFSPLPAVEFWTRHETLTYIAKNSTMLPGIGAQLELPYAFVGRAVPFNESLWTLPHELQMYILLAVLGAFRALRWPLTAIGLVVIGAAAFTLDLIGAASPLSEDRARFVFLFFSGAAMYMLRNYISMKLPLFLACILAWVAAATLTADHKVHRLVLLATVPYMALWLSFVPRGLIRRFNALGDYSYGTYILAGPVQAYLVTRSASPLATFSIAMAIVVPMAAISWHLLESRALAIPLPAAAKGRDARVPVGTL